MSQDSAAPETFRNGEETESGTRKRRGNSAVRTGKVHVKEHSVRNYLNPWMTGAAMVPAGGLLHLAWGDQPVMIGILGASSVVVTGAANRMWSRRHEHTRILATAYAAAASMWCTWTAADGLHRAEMNGWGIGTVVLSILWNLRFASFSPAHEHDRSGSDHDPVFSAIGSLKGARLRRLKADEKNGRVTVDVQLKPGESTATAVQGDRELIASAVGMPADAVTVKPGGRADRAVITFQEQEALGTTVRWPGPGRLGRSVVDEPIHLGIRADGTPLDMWTVGDSDDENPRQLPHTLCTGVNGSGKTETIKTAILSLRECRDSVPIVGDPAKFGQSWGDVEDCLGLAARTESQVNQLIRNLKPAIAYRAELLGSLERPDGSRGYSQWEPECWTLHRVPHLFIDIEEAADVLSNMDDEFDHAIRKARSVGMSLCASLQSAGHYNIARQTRGQFTNALTHGCVEDQDAKFSLSSHSRDAGADPTKWRNNYPGSCYGELVGTPQSSWAVDARAFYTTRAQRREWVAASKTNGHWAVIDPGTLEILGRGILPDPEPVQEPVDDHLEDDADGSVYAPQDGPEQAPIEDALADSMDPSQPLEPPTGEPLELAPRQARTDYARAAVELARHIRERAVADQLEFAYADLGDLAGSLGVSRPWVYKQLEAMETAGHLERVGSGGMPPWRINPAALDARPALV